MTYPSGRVVTTTYGAAGRISNVGASTTAYATLKTAPTQNIFAYAVNGAIQAMTLGNGVVETTTFNNRFQPLGISAAKGSANLLGLTPAWARRLRRTTGT